MTWSFHTLQARTLFTGLYFWGEICQPDVGCVGISQLLCASRAGNQELLCKFSAVYSKPELMVRLPNVSVNHCTQTHSSFQLNIKLDKSHIFTGIAFHQKYLRFLCSKSNIVPTLCAKISSTWNSYSPPSPALPPFARRQLIRPKSQCAFGQQGSQSYTIYKLHFKHPFTRFFLGGEDTATYRFLSKFASHNNTQQFWHQSMNKRQQIWCLSSRPSVGQQTKWQVSFSDYEAGLS